MSLDQTGAGAYMESDEQRLARVRGIGTAASDPMLSDLEQDTNFEVSEESVWADFTKDAQQNVSKKEVRVKVPNRPTWTLIHDPNIEYDMYEAWQKKCTTGRGDKATLNWKQLAVIVLSNTTKGILVNDRPLRKNGVDITMTSDQFCQAMGLSAGMTRAAIKKAFGSDADMLAAMRLIITRAGYAVGDEDDMEATDGPLDS